MEIETKNGAAVKRNSRILIVVFVIVTTISIGLSFFRFFILRDYPLQSQIECDPTTEACFVYHCDATVEECTGDPVVDTSYYKLIDRNAKNIPLCDPANEDCVPLECQENEVGCVITLCDASLEDGSECSDPEAYNMLNAPVEVLEPQEQVMDTEFPEMNVESNIGE